MAYVDYVYILGESKRLTQDELGCKITLLFLRESVPVSLTETERILCNSRCSLLPIVDQPR